MSLADNWQNIPESMTGAKQWLCFTLRDDGRDRLSKPPVSPKTGSIVDKTDESHWVKFHRAYGAYESNDNIDGVGFIFDNGFMAIDLDDCFDDNGSLLPVAQDILDHFAGAYVEYSPSGNGLHIFVRGVKPNNRTKANGIEVYTGKNFVTVTGDMTAESGFECLLMQDEIDWMFETYLPEQNSKKVDYTAIAADHGDNTPEEWLNIGLEKDAKLALLYNDKEHDGDESSQDMALLCKLAYWLNRDYDEIESAFMESPWFVSKDTAHTNKCIKRKDYLHDSIANAINRTTETASERVDKLRNRVKVRIRPAVGGDGKSLVDARFLDDLTDAGCAVLLGEVYGDILRYSDALGWSWYNGKYWEHGSRVMAMGCVVDLTDAILEEALAWLEELNIQADEEAWSDEERKKRTYEVNQLLAYLRKSRNAKSFKSILEVAQEQMYTDVSVFDANEWILNTPLCLIDLRTGERLPHKPEYMCTCITSVTPDDNQDNALWQKTLRDTFMDDELIRYAQLHMGSALIGKVFQENLVIANGNGANGKSTFFGAIQTVLGDYATSVDPELLLSARPAEQQVGMAMLHGKRLAIAQETDEGKAICGSMLKRLVSTDTMVAKKLYHNPFTFIPTHTLILSTNHLPRIKSNDTGTWRRIDILPFNNTITPDKMITDFMGVLVKECGNAILQWCVDGAKMFYENECKITQAPQEVLEAKAEYREQEDWLMLFMTDCVRDSASVDDTVSHNELYSAYKAWCTINGVYVRSSIALGKALKQAGWKFIDRQWNSNTQKLEKLWLGKELAQGSLNKGQLIKLRAAS